MPVTATTLEELVREVYLADTALTGFMTRSASVFVNGVPGGGWPAPSTPIPGWYFPRADASPGAESQTPFIIQRFRGFGGRYVYHTGWATYIYDKPEFGFTRIDEILHILRAKFVKEVMMPPTVQGYEYYGRAIYEYSTSNQVDPDWTLNFGFLRVSTHAL